MKKILIIFTFCCALIVGAVFVIALPKTEQTIQSTLQDIGFKNVTIGHASFNLTGINFNNIQLDKDGFSVISNLNATIFWPKFFLSSKITSITIEEVRLSMVPRDLRYAIKKFNASSLLASAKNITINKIILDLAAPNHALQFNGALSIQETSDNKKSITAQLSAKQHELAFNSKWAGKIDAKSNTIEIDGDFEELKINASPLNLNRGNGWLSYSSQNGNSIVSAQFDAGNGKILGIPTKNINIILGQDPDGYPVLFRANAAGIENVQLTGDFLYTTGITNRMFNATLDIPRTDQFFEYLKVQNIIPNTTKKLTGDVTTINTLLVYTPEKRFAGGPLPFDVSIQTDLKDQLTGTFLIYPDSFDIRGTTETSKPILDILNAVFTIPEENVVDNVIRLDGNIKSLVN
jgi:hypothetical protein